MQIGSLWKHCKRGTFYRILCHATLFQPTLSSDMDPCVVYLDGNSNQYCVYPEQLFAPSVFRGKTLHFICNATLQCDDAKDMEECVVYKAQADDKVWVRPTKEFYDRFVLMEPPT